MLEQSLQESFPLSIVMQKTTVSNNIWETEQWAAIGVVVGERQLANDADSEVIHRDDKSEQILFPGYAVTLYKDECESYYYNMLSDNPTIYIVCRRDEVEEGLQPLLVSASYDEAAAYLETDDEVYTVPMPKELHQWVEAYILQHYVPEKKKKRKLKNWKEEEPGTQRGMIQ
ncbi:MAG: DUF3305 domain-containing protein [Gammaproteobacteria bacterium]|nr:DUF3305 domain-containing protein [Gammaproteobacteria bacterium]